MPVIHALQHLFSSVERGLFPQRGRGFQTLAVSAELIGTEDLRALEDVAFYALSRERIAAAAFPVKETFFQLPSGSFAIGRMVYLGTDSLGREGNYLTHHLVISRAELIAAGADPFVILDAATFADAGADLTPRELPPLVCEVTLNEQEFHFSDERLALLATAAIDRGDKTVLLIGDEAVARKLLRELFAALPIEERLRLTFSTHFYEAHHLRELFAVASVSARAEAPSQLQQYSVIDLNERTEVRPASAYSVWLTECLKEGKRAEIVALNHALNQLRNGQRDIAVDSLPVSARACAALWERAGTRIAPALVGNARWIRTFLDALENPRPLAEALLAIGSPSVLCGDAATGETISECLNALKSSATGKIWSEWTKHWSDDPALAMMPAEKSWWQKWKR
jgi:hypothetical protein